MNIDSLSSTRSLSVEKKTSSTNTSCHCFYDLSYFFAMARVNRSFFISSTDRFLCAFSYVFCASYISFFLATHHLVDAFFHIAKSVDFFSVSHYARIKMTLLRDAYATDQRTNDRKKTWWTFFLSRQDENEIESAMMSTNSTNVIHIAWWKHAPKIFLYSWSHSANFHHPSTKI